MRMKSTGTGFVSISMMLDKMASAATTGVHSVDVGVVKTAMYPKGNLSVADVAKLNEYGFKSSNGEPVPPRPFMRIALEKSRNDANIQAALREGITARSPTFDSKTAGKIGAIIHANIIEAIFSSKIPPNKPSTIRRKKSSQPLIDTSKLRRSLAWRVNKSTPASDGNILIIT